MSISLHLRLPLNVRVYTGLLIMFFFLQSKIALSEVTDTTYRYQNGGDSLLLSFGNNGEIKRQTYYYKNGRLKSMIKIKTKMQNRQLIKSINKEIHWSEEGEVLNKLTSKMRCKGLSCKVVVWKYRENGKRKWERCIRDA